MKENVREFLNDIIDVYIKHNMSISHEDYQGGFIIEDMSDYNVDWLTSAEDKTIQESK